MIDELIVSGSGGIRFAKLSFKGDFIVITGESGSGKSSLVRAIEFIAGKRAQSGLIHSLEETCDVQAVIFADSIDGLLEEYAPEDGVLLARRTFSRSGRGKCSLQGMPLPVSMMAFAMEKEIVIQSQFSQLGLLEPSKQLELVDSCGGEIQRKTSAMMQSAFADAVNAEKEIIALKRKRKELEDKYQDFENILRHIASLGLNADSENVWMLELKALEAKIKQQEALTSALRSFGGDGTGEGLMSELENWCREIYTLVPNDDNEWHEHIETMLSSSQAVFRKLTLEAGSLNDTGSLEDAKDRLEKKLGLLRKIKRTLNLLNCSDIIEYEKSAKEDIEWLKNSRIQLEESEEKSRSLKKEIALHAAALRNMRRTSAKNLAESVNSHLKDLAMEYAVFDIEVESTDKVRATGADSVCFTLALPDQKPLPVGKTASGGELSRILIALQLSVGDDKLPGTLVFDEVEAGLGGKAALLAGYKLRELSKRCRTILITHDAGIAAMADQHFLVKRDGDETSVSEITGEEREKEIARMLAGEESGEALSHAKYLLGAR